MLCDMKYNVCEGKKVSVVIMAGWLMSHKVTEGWSTISEQCLPSTRELSWQRRQLECDLGFWRSSRLTRLNKSLVMLLVSRSKLVGTFLGGIMGCSSNYITISIISVCIITSYISQASLEYIYSFKIFYHPKHKGTRKC